MAEIILVRHTEISNVWKKRCYGVSDVPLSPIGEAAVGPLAGHLATYRPKHVIHSGLSRTKKLAVALAGHVGCPMTENKAFRELDFGNWEGCTWDEVFAEVGHGMARMITEPETFAPPNGETVHAVRDRVVGALLQISADGPTIVVTHGGPIGAVRGTLENKPAREWTELVPSYGAATSLTKADLLQLKAAFAKARSC